MLGFFRRYQKGLFLVVGVIVLASFTFFGVQNAFGDRQFVQKDRTIGRAIDGSDMHLLEIEHIRRFIRSDKFDRQLLQHGEMPNMLNDGILRKDFLEEGLVAPLYSAFGAPLEEPLMAKVEKHKKFRPYVNKAVPFMAVETLWDQFNPELKKALAAFKNEEGKDALTYAKELAALYRLEQDFPPHMIKQFLQYQLRQYPWAADNELTNGSLTLFRAKTIGDWFGESFVEASAQSIHNMALLARQKGYTVSANDAKNGMLGAIHELLRTEKGSTPSAAEVQQVYRSQLDSLGMQESDAVSVWQKVLLVRAYLDGEAAKREEPVAESEYDCLLKKKVEKQGYALSEKVALTSFMDMLEHEVYLNAITTPQARKSIHPLDIPQVFLPVQHVEKKVPDLVVKKHALRMKHVTKSSALAAIAVQEVWEKELSEPFFAELQKEFPQLKNSIAGDVTSREMTLSALPKEVRARVDTFTQKAILAENPERIAVEMEIAPFEEQEIELSSGSIDKPFEGISDMAAFIEAFKENRLEMYSQDEEHFYTVEMGSADEIGRILSFEEARERGVLRELLDKELLKKYEELKLKEPALVKGQNGEIEPFESMRETVGKKLFAPLVDAIAEYAGNKSLPLQECHLHRFAYYVKGITEKMDELPEQGALFVQGAEGESDLQSQWKLRALTATCVEGTPSAWQDDEAYTLPLATWSHPHVSSGGVPYMYKVASLTSDTTKKEAAIATAKKERHRAAKQEVAKEALLQMKEKEAITFGYMQDDE